MSYAISGLGQIAAVHGDLREARQRYEEALAIRNEIGEKGTTAESRLALATVSLEEGRPAEAEGPAGEAAEQFREQKDADNEALALAILARSLLAQNKPSEAQQGIARAPGVGSAYPRLSMAIVAARVDAASGKPAAAFESLKTTLAKATNTGMLGLQFEARLALGEIEMKSGDRAAGQARLEALEREAAARGYGLIARKAKRLRQ